MEAILSLSTLPLTPQHSLYSSNTQNLLSNLIENPAFFKFKQPVLTDSGRK